MFLRNKKIHLRYNRTEIELDINDVFYIYYEAKTITIVCNNKRYCIYLSMAEAEYHLDSTPLKKLHKNYIINTEKIKNIIGNKVVLDEYQQLIPVNQKYLQKNYINIYA